MDPRRFSPGSRRARQIGRGVYFVYAGLLIAHLVTAGEMEMEMEISWWRTPLLSAPFLFALILHEWQRPTDVEGRLRTRRWHDPRIHSAQER